MIIIKEYNTFKNINKDFNKDLKKQIIDFLKNQAIDEFGFVEWKDYLENKDFTPYLTNESLFVIIYDNNKIIATIAGLKKDIYTIKLNSFYVDKDYRNKKLGKYLYNLFYEFSKKYYKTIILCTYDVFDIAYNFYQKQNFILYKIDGKEKWLCEAMLG